MPQISLSDFVENRVPPFVHCQIDCDHHEAAIGERIPILGIDPVDAGRIWSPHETMTLEQVDRQAGQLAPTGATGPYAHKVLPRQSEWEIARLGILPFPPLQQP